jgi:hypothetical protein
MPNTTPSRIWNANSVAAGYPAPGVGSSAIIAGQKAIVGGIRHVDSFPQKIPAPVFGENAAGIKREHAAV